MPFTLDSKKLPLTQARALTATTIFCTLLVLEVIYELLIRHLDITDCFWLAPLNSSLYTFIFIATFRLDLLRLSVCYLALPYLIFFPGWLNTAAATIMILVFSYSLYQTLKENTSAITENTNASALAGFVAILIWVNLSGAGGYGYQTFDYTIHNGRLLDLINYSWPVHYTTDKNFIYYTGYYLPSAFIGKVLGYTAGMRSMFLWTVIGICLALRWMSSLSTWKFSAPLVIAFALFGPMSILGVAYFYTKIQIFTPGISLSQLWEYISYDADSVDFWASRNSDFFIGNFLSNTYGLYWSPQQVIAGWIYAGTLTHLFYRDKSRQFIFIFALLSLWAPLVMIAMIPIVIGTIMSDIRRWRDMVTLENIIGGGSLVIVFFIFYSAGSVTKNPSHWIFSAESYDEILLLFVFSWIIYLTSMTNQIKNLNKKEKILLGLVAFSSAVLPLRTYGEYSDLLCRGSAPLMFLILAFFLGNIKKTFQEKNKKYFYIFVILFIIGTVSSLFHIKNAIVDYGAHQPTASIISYPNAYPNLGDDNNIFQKYLARKNR